MKVLIVNQREVRRLLPMNECISVMSDALASLARGDAVLPLRAIMWLPDRRGVLGMMPSFLGDIGAVGLKVITVFPGNHGSRYDSHQGAVLLFETHNGQLVSIMDASSITAIRTAAVSGLATKLLARKDAETLAILGSGVQARTHLAAMREVRPLKKIVVWSRSSEHAEKFAARESPRYGMEISVASSVHEAAQDADIICTTTASRDPILEGAWIRPGTHINAVGSSSALARELDAEAMRISRLYVDRVESTLNESGDFIIAKREGAFGDEHIVGEIGDIVIGKLEGRRTDDEVTLFKSLGIGVEDLAAANHIYRKATESAVGTFVELGGERDDD